MTTTIDLSSPSFATDPYPIYRELQETAPAYQVSFGPRGSIWLITRYADVTTLFKEAAFSNDLRRIMPADKLPSFSQALTFRDPPDHTRLRALVSQAFTPQRIKDLEPRIAAIVDELLARVRPSGTMDVIAELALPLPVRVIAELLGVPSDDQLMFKAWSDAIARGADNQHGNAETIREGRAASQALTDYFRQLVEQRRRQPQDDLVSAMLDARDQHDQLSEDELLETCAILLLAGYETTTRLLSNGLVTLLRHPDQLALLRERPELLPHAIEEMLRFESPVQQTMLRTTTAPVEIAGQRIAAGQMLSAVVGAANRDPAQFPAPDRFDITRDPNRHLAFGYGIHFCLGAPLARAEARIAFARLLEQLPALQLGQPEPEWAPNTRVRGLRSLHVTF